MIENDLSKLYALYKRGVRYMTLTWNNSTAWATSAADETTPGCVIFLNFYSGFIDSTYKKKKNG